MFKKAFGKKSGGSGGAANLPPPNDDDDDKQTEMRHPDSAIRVASAVHRFGFPKISGKVVSFQRAFKTVGTHAVTMRGLHNADDGRKKLQEALTAKTLKSDLVYEKAAQYLPCIHQLLLTCSAQPEMARLDERLNFEWQSGVEKEPQKCSSEALMYDMVMCLATEALAKAASATEASSAGDFAAASRDYAAAAGIMKSMGDDHLPQWMAKGTNVQDQKLPIETNPGVCKAFEELFLANGQQMAIATVLSKPGAPNYGLLAKLGLGAQERLARFTTMLRKEAFHQMERMDPEIFTLCTFETTVLESLTNYFYARARWEQNNEYGIAIALLTDANAILKTRTNVASKGLPEIPKTSTLYPLQREVADLRNHYAKLLKAWNDDNGRVYFEQVPPRVPDHERVPQSLLLTKPTPFDLPDDVAPLVLQPPTVLAKWA